MRFLTLILLSLGASLCASEPHAYPLWDGTESVADYAKRVDLPPTKTLDLGNGVRMELVLIPAGKFVMGTPEPTPVDEDGFNSKIIAGQALLAASVGALLVIMTVVIIRAVRQRQRPRVSLARLLAMTVLASVAVLSGLHWHASVREFEQAKAAFVVAMSRFKVARPEEKPAHPITLTRPFYMGKFSVTQEQYLSILGGNQNIVKGKDYPAETAAFNDAENFCRKLMAQTQQAIRLPTEAEWEYACRAGTTTTYHSGDREADLDRVAWYATNSKKAAHPVGQKEANVFGLYDMHGNVWQWCQDRWDDTYYANSPSENPEGSELASLHVMRGGSWGDAPDECRAACRLRFPPGIHRRTLSRTGFRVVVTIPLSRP